MHYSGLNGPKKIFRKFIKALLPLEKPGVFTL
jgi:hypothetical protein